MAEALFVEVILVAHVSSWVEQMLACLAGFPRMASQVYD
jgi:hypothetical protein